MAVVPSLVQRLQRLAADPELPRLCPGLHVDVHFVVGRERVGFSLVDGGIRLGEPTGDDGISIIADADAWARLLETPPPPTFHAFTALQLANTQFELLGPPLLIAQSRPALERIFEVITQSSALPAAPVRRSLDLIEGRYHRIIARGAAYDLYVERSGTGIPTLLLHTAGADSRQFQAQLSDLRLAQDFRFYAPDLPFHGRSNPPSSWDGAPYTLSKARYLDWCSGIITQIVKEPVLIVGGSMGAAIALCLAAERPDLVLGVVAVEPPYQSKGRLNAYQNHVGVHGNLHNGSFVRGLMSPQSPIADRRRASWIYSQGAPGIYPGDLAFYSQEFDAATIAPRIDAHRTPIALLCGAYDYSATPADGQRIADLIPGAVLRTMPSMGHFPMCEHPDAFAPYLYDALRHASGKTRVTA